MKGMSANIPLTVTQTSKQGQFPDLTGFVLRVHPFILPLIAHLRFKYGQITGRRTESLLKHTDFLMS